MGRTQVGVARTVAACIVTHLRLVSFVLIELLIWATASRLLIAEVSITDSIRDNLGLTGNHNILSQSNNICLFISSNVSIHLSLLITIFWFYRLSSPSGLQLRNDSFFLLLDLPESWPQAFQFSFKFFNGYPFLTSSTVSIFITANVLVIRFNLLGWSMDMFRSVDFDQVLEVFSCFVHFLGRLPLWVEELVLLVGLERLEVVALFYFELNWRDLLLKVTLLLVNWHWVFYLYVVVIKMWSRRRNGRSSASMFWVCSRLHLLIDGLESLLHLLEFLSEKLDFLLEWILIGELLN